MDLAEKVALAEQKLTQLTSKLTDAEQRVVARDTVITAKDAEIASLKATIKAQEDRESDRLVAEAHESYPDKMSREAKGALFKGDRTLFDKEFPHVPTAQRILQHNLTDKKGDESTPRTVIDQPGAGTVVEETILQTTKRLMKERHLTHAQAQNEALKLHRQAG